MAKKKSDIVIAEEMTATAVKTEATEETKTPTVTAVKTEVTKKDKKSMPSLSDDIAAATEETSKKVGPARVSAEGEVTPKKVTAKYNVKINGESKLMAGSKVSMAVTVLRHALENGMSQTELNESKFVATFALLRDYPENTTRQDIIDDLGKDKVRYATKETMQIHHSKSIMVVCNQWYPANAEKLSLAMQERFPEIKITES